MLLLGILFLALSANSAQSFNITHLVVPEVVPPNVKEVAIECHYDANFTLLSWYKGSNEFFRYKPGAAPSTRSFPILGVGRVEMLSCGPTACRLRLGALTDEATGLYRCDIERAIAPYNFETRSAYMHVYGHEHRRPLLEGLAEEFGDGDEIQAYCRGAQDAEIRWYINGYEVEDMRGKPTLKRRSSRLIFMGTPPMVTVQCAEFRFGRLSGSKEAKARWKDFSYKVETAQEQRINVSSENASNRVSACMALISTLFLFCFSNV